MERGAFRRGAGTVANDAARVGSDYVAKSGSLTIAAGQRVQSVGVLVRVDRVKEGSESFFVDLSGAVGGGDDWGG